MSEHFRIWNRQSRRHKWRLCLETDSKERADAFFDVEVTRLSEWGKWPLAEVGMDSIMREPGGRAMRNEDFTLPQNAPMLKVWKEQK